MYDFPRPHAGRTNMMRWRSTWLMCVRKVRGNLRNPRRRPEKQLRNLRLHPTCMACSDNASAHEVGMQFNMPPSMSSLCRCYHMCSHCPISSLRHRHPRSWALAMKTSRAWSRSRTEWMQRLRRRLIPRAAASPWRLVKFTSSSQYACMCSSILYISFDPGHPLTHIPNLLQTKKKLQKFMDSIVQKSGKIRALIRDVHVDYTKSGMMTRH